MTENETKQQLQHVKYIQLQDKGKMNVLWLREAFMGEVKTKGEQVMNAT